VSAAYITSRRPAQVAADVERERERGCSRFIIKPVARGGMLDQERLGAARYAAGLHADVELEEASAVALPR